MPELRQNVAGMLCNQQTTNVFVMQIQLLPVDPSMHHDMPAAITLRLNR